MKISDGRNVELEPPADIEGGDQDLLRINKTSNKTYAFDCGFDQSATQEEVFEGTTKRFIQDIIDGYNATCFAYGATGAGKTYT